MISSCIHLDFSIAMKAYFCEILLAKTAENCVHYDYDLDFFWKIITKEENLILVVMVTTSKDLKQKMYK